APENPLGLPVLLQFRKEEPVREQGARPGLRGEVEDRIEQHLQRRLRNTLFAATQRDEGSEVSAGAVTANADSGRVSAQFGGVFTCPSIGRDAVIGRSRGGEVGREPVVNPQ